MQLADIYDQDEIDRNNADKLYFKPLAAKYSIEKRGRDGNDLGLIVAIKFHTKINKYYITNGGKWYNQVKTVIISMIDKGQYNQLYNYIEKLLRDGTAEVLEEGLRDWAKAGVLVGAGALGALGINQLAQRSQPTQQVQQTQQIQTQARTVNLGGPRKAIVSIDGVHIRVEFIIGAKDTQLGKIHIQKLGESLAKKVNNKYLYSNGMQISGNKAYVNFTTRSIH